MEQGSGIGGARIMAGMKDESRLVWGKTSEKENTTMTKPVDF